MRRLWRWLRPCDHDWQLTGAYYVGPQATLQLRQCSRCNETAITIA